MGRKAYWELLRDPRWQRRRLEVMQRSAFKCERCEAAEETLNVHHRLYRKGAMPWDYADAELIVLCEPCHEAEHRTRELIAEALALMEPNDLEQMLGYMHGQLLLTGRANSVELRNCEHAAGVSDSATGVGHMRLYDLINSRDQRTDSIGLDVLRAWGDTVIQGRRE